MATVSKISSTAFISGQNVNINGTYTATFSPMAARLGIEYQVNLIVSYTADMAQNATIKVPQPNILVTSQTMTSSFTASLTVLSLNPPLITGVSAPPALRMVLQPGMKLSLELIPDLQGVLADSLVTVVADDTTNDLKGTITARGENAPNEAKEKLFDNQPNTKWLDFSPTGSWIQYTYAGGAFSRLNGYSLTSASDSPERDPASWQLLGSNDGGVHWVTLDSRAGVTFSQRNQKQHFYLPGDASYQSYRLNITKVFDPSIANCVQLAELELLGFLP